MVFDKVVNIIREQLGVENEVEITKNTSMMKDLEADSLDAVEVMMALEDEFGMEIPDEDAEKFVNIGDIVSYIEAHQ